MYMYLEKNNIDPGNPLKEQSRLLTTMRTKAGETLLETEKMLVTSIFSVSHDVFHPYRKRI